MMLSAPNTDYSWPLYSRTHHRSLMLTDVAEGPEEAVALPTDRAANHQNAK